MDKINPLIIDGDRRAECIHGLRQQRDEARREICEGIAARDEKAGYYQQGYTKKSVACKRGWSYLYEEKEEKSDA